MCLIVLQELQMSLWKSFTVLEAKNLKRFMLHIFTDTTQEHVILINISLRSQHDNIHSDFYMAC